MKIVRRSVAVFVALIVTALLAPHCIAGTEGPAEMSISIGGAFGRMVVRPKVQPFSVFKNRGIVKQGLDFSCGAAATATIFNHYLGEPVTEGKVIDVMFRAGDVDRIVARQGFSLLDIKRFAEYMGYRAAGYRTDMEGLASLKKPCIVAILLRDYKHFVVFKGIEEGKVFLADPALGNTTVGIREFERMWYGHIVLVIEPRDQTLKADLDIKDEDRIMVSAGDVRRSLFYNAILLGKGPRDF